MGTQTIAREQIRIVPSFYHVRLVVGRVIRSAGASAASEGEG